MSVVHSTDSFFFLNCLIAPAAINNRTVRRIDPPSAHLINSNIGSINSNGNPVFATGCVAVVNVLAIDLDDRLRKLIAVLIVALSIFVYCFRFLDGRFITSSTIEFGKFTVPTLNEERL